MGVTIGRENFEGPITSDLEDRDIEGSSTEVIDGDLLIRILIGTVGEGSCCRLVDDTLDVESCDLSCIDRRLTFCIIEVGRDGDNSLSDFLSEEFLGIGFEFFENFR